MHRDIKP
jgi:casein kinase II subunit alpha